MTEVYKRIGEIQADHFIKECKKHNQYIGAVIQYIDDNK